MTSIPIGQHANTFENLGWPPTTVERSFDSLTGLSSITEESLKGIAVGDTINVTRYAAGSPVCPATWQLVADNAALPSGAVAGDVTGAAAGRLYVANGDAYYKFEICGTRYAQAFGCVGDGVTDDTAGAQAALDSLVRTSPYAYAGYGVGTIKFSAGSFVLSGLIYNSALGLVFEGEGQFATSLIFASDSGALFTSKTYGYVTWRDMSIIHKPVGAKSGWSCVCFDLDSDGGGRDFSLERVQTRNFDRIFSDGNTTNSDRFSGIKCQFSGFKTFFRSRNPQAVVNGFEYCTWESAKNDQDCNAIFDIAGMGHTALETCTIMYNGPAFKFAAAAGVYGESSVYTLRNVKWEWRGDNTRVLTGDGTNVGPVQMMFSDCGLSGGDAPTPGTPWATFGFVNGRFRFIGGSFPSTIEVRPRTAESPRKDYIRFEGMHNAPTNITYLTAADGFGMPEISWSRCRNMPDQTYGRRTGRFSDARTTEVFSNPSRGDYVISTGAGAEFAFELKAPCLLHSLKFIHAQNITGASDKTIEVFSDSGRTSKVGEIVIPGGSLAPYAVYISTVPADTVLTSGMYFTVTNPNSNTMRGYLVADYTSIPFN